MPDQQVVRQVAAVQPYSAQSGKSYWGVTDDQGQEWKVWEASVAMQAQQLLGQMALMTVRISPAKDPTFGMNYVLKAIGPAQAGAQPTAMPLAQPVQMEMQPQMPMQQPQAMPQMPMTMPLQPVMPAMSMPVDMPEVLRPPIKTLGQGGTMSDADITRMARSTAINAVVGVAFTYEDFRDEDTGTADWAAIYAAAEACSKFILFRRHEGWTPGREIAPHTTAEQEVMAEVQAEFPEGLVELPMMPTQPEVNPTQASAEQAQGGEVGWGE